MKLNHLSQAHYFLDIAFLKIFTDIISCLLTIVNFVAIFCSQFFILGGWNFYTAPLTRYINFGSKLRKFKRREKEANATICAYIFFLLDLIRKNHGLFSLEKRFVKICCTYGNFSDYFDMKEMVRYFD